MKGWLNSPHRWTIEIWVWTIATVLVIILSLVFPPLWLKIATVYLAVVSNYALVLTAAGARQASEARIAAREGNVSKEDLTEHLVQHTSLEKVRHDEA